MRTIRTPSVIRSALTALAVLLFLITTSASAAGDHGSRAKWRAQALERALAANPQTFQFTNMRNIAVSPAEGAAGGAFLIRSKNGLTVRIMLGDLEPGHAYTFWWIFFNKPGECLQTPCAATDLMAASGAIHYGSGAIAGADGTANVTFSTTSGGPPEGAAGNPTLPKRGLMTNRGFKAEVHFVVVDHEIPAVADVGSDDPDVAGTWAWELTHPLPPGPAWVRDAIFLLP